MRSLPMLSSACALAAILACGDARAQTTSFNAPDPRIVSGNVNYDRVSAPGTEIYNIGSPTAVLDFTPSDSTGTGVINFQNAGTTAIYQNAPGNPNFTVLNRIVPTNPSRPIAFNGRVVSQLQGATLGHGGSVWFYSPGGIVVGTGAVFDIGNLLLTTADPTGGSGTISSATTFTLNSRADSGATVNLAVGATINATVPGSYVALVAPVIFQEGTVNINGSAAYVAAEQATLTFNQGLFTIDLAVGSSVNGGNSLRHIGTTRFIDATGQRRAYFVAMPKNEAITLLIESAGTIGFETATAASLQNGRIVLSSGNPGTRDTAIVTAQGGQVSNIAINRGTFNAPVIASASGNITILPTGATSFAGNVILNAGFVVSVMSNSAGTPLNFAGDLVAEALPGVFRRTPQNATSIVGAGNGGTLRIAGNLTARTLVNAGGADVFGGAVFLGGPGGNTSIGGAVLARAQDITLRNRLGGTTSAGSYDLAATRSILSAPAQTGDSPGPITGGTFLARAFNGDAIIDTDINVNGSIDIVAGGGVIRTRTMTATQDVTLFSRSGITTGDVTALSIDIDDNPDVPTTPASAADDIVTGNLLAEKVQVSGRNDVRLGNVTAVERIAGRTPDTPYIATVNADRNASMGNVMATSFVGVAAQAGNVTAGNVTTGGSVLILAANQVSLGAVSGGRGATDSVFVSSLAVLGSGAFAGVTDLDDLEIEEFDPAALATTVPTRVAGPISFGGAIGAGNLLARTAAALSVQGTIVASTKLDLRAGGAATFAGSAASPAMLIESSDLVLGDAATLGDATTANLTLQPFAASAPVFFGGDGSGGGYNVSAAEVSRLRGREIVLNTIAPQGTIANVTVRSFTVNGSLAGTTANLLGDAGTLRILTPNSVRVTGAVTVNNAAANNLLFIGGRERVEVVTDGGGSITMNGQRSDTQGAAVPLGGTLEMVANNLSIGTGSLLEQLQANPRFAGRDAALATVPATARPEGFIQANRIEFEGVDTVAVQNSGAAGTFAGFTAGAGGLELRTGRGREGTPVTTPADLVIYGRIQSSGGGFLTNRQTLAGATITKGDQTAGFSPTSALNGCLLSAGACEGGDRGGDQDTTVVTIATNVEGAIASASSDPDTVASLPAVRLATIIDAAALTTDALIEEPVTSGGNATLWDGSEATGSASGTGDDPEDADRKERR